MPEIYVLVGLPGHGKSFVASVIEEKTGATHINVDLVRDEITDGNPQYTQEESEQTYSTLIERGKELYENGSSVVLDGTFNIKSGRDRVKQIAGDDVTFVYIDCDESTAKKRLEERDGISGATPEVYDKFRLKPIEYDHILIDNNGTKQNTKKQIEEKIVNGV